MDTLIEIRNIYKSYRNNPTPIIDNLSLEIKKGEKFGIFGPNGAGKTTLISMMCDILQPTKGEITYHVDGKIFTTRLALKYIGYVPQDFAFYPQLSAAQNLKYFGKMYGISGDVLEQKIDQILETLGLSHVKDKKVKTFSGGMMRRINLAIGVIHEPKILFLDEPTVGVDIQSKKAIMQLLEKLNEQGTSIIYTSHHLKEAEDFCTRIALIDHGQIIGLGDLQSLMENNKVANLEELVLALTGEKLRD